MIIKYTELAFFVFNQFNFFAIDGMEQSKVGDEAFSAGKRYALHGDETTKALRTLIP